MLFRSTGVATGAGLWRASLIAVTLALVVLSLGGRVDRKLHPDEIND